MTAETVQLPVLLTGISSQLDRAIMAREMVRMEEFEFIFQMLVLLNDRVTLVTDVPPARAGLLGSVAGLTERPV